MSETHLIYLAAKALLSILKHRTIEKSVDRCEMSIAEAGPEDTKGSLDNGAENKLTMCFHCKHGMAISPI